MDQLNDLTRSELTLAISQIQAPSKPCCILGKVLDIIIQTWTSLQAEH